MTSKERAQVIEDACPHDTTSVSYPAAAVLAVCLACYDAALARAHAEGKQEGLRLGRELALNLLDDAAGEIRSLIPENE